MRRRGASSKTVTRQADWRRLLRTIHQATACSECPEQNLSPERNLPRRQGSRHTLCQMWLASLREFCRMSQGFHVPNGFSQSLSSRSAVCECGPSACVLWNYFAIFFSCLYFRNNLPCFPAILRTPVGMSFWVHFRHTPL